MDEQMKERLAESMDKVLGYVEQGADFAVEQAPLVAQEIVTWGIAEGVISVVVATPLLCVVVFVLKRIWTRKEDRHFDEIDAAFATFFTLLAGVLPAILFCTGLFQAAKALLAPRLYILEQIGRLL